MLSIVVVHDLRFFITFFRKGRRSPTAKVLLKNNKCMRDKAQDTRRKAHSPTIINPPSNGGKKAQSIQSNSHHHALRRVWMTGPQASVGAKFLSSFLGNLDGTIPSCHSSKQTFVFPPLFSLYAQACLTH